MASQVNPQVYGAELAFWLCIELARPLFGRDKPPYEEAAPLVDAIRALLNGEGFSDVEWLYDVHGAA